MRKVSRPRLQVAHKESGPLFAVLNRRRKVEEEHGISATVVRRLQRRPGQQPTPAEFIAI